MKTLWCLEILWIAGLLACCPLGAAPAHTMPGRTVISLDGQWEIAEGSMDAVPAQFEHRVPVPGLVDEARPPFAEVGQKSPRREAFWYRRTFRVKGEVPAVAVLKLHKAAYGSRVLLNGVLLGEHLPSFTPGYFDARPALRGNGAVNELVVRVGATREALPPTVASGWDFEKSPLHPGHLRFGRVDSVRDAEHCARAGGARDCQPDHSRAGGGAECRPEDQHASCASRCARRARESPPARAARNRSRSTATPSRPWRCAFPFAIAGSGRRRTRSSTSWKRAPARTRCAPASA